MLGIEWGWCFVYFEIWVCLVEDKVLVEYVMFGCVFVIFDVCEENEVLMICKYCGVIVYFCCNVVCCVVEYSSELGIVVCVGDWEI